jgi:hypothetical protein
MKQDPIERKQTPRSILNAENDNGEPRSGLLYKIAAPPVWRYVSLENFTPSRVLHCTVSSVTCQVSRVTVRYVIEAGHRLSIPVAGTNHRFAIVRIPVAIGNAVARTKVMKTPTLRDLLMLKEQV